MERHQEHINRRTRTTVNTEPIFAPRTPEWETRDYFGPSGSSPNETVTREDLRSICTFPPTDTLEDNTCHICLNTFTESDEPAKLPCGHILGSSCLTTWTNERRYPTCPICREPYLRSPPQGHRTSNLDEIDALRTQADSLLRSIADEEQHLSDLNAQVVNLQRQLAQTAVQRHGLERRIADLGERATQVAEGVEELHREAQVQPTISHGALFEAYEDFRAQRERGRYIQATTNHHGAAFEAYRAFSAQRYRGVPLTVGLGASPDLGELGQLIRRNRESLRRFPELLADRGIPRPFRPEENARSLESTELVRSVQRLSDTGSERSINELPNVLMGTSPNLAELYQRRWESPQRQIAYQMARGVRPLDHSRSIGNTEPSTSVQPFLSNELPDIGTSPSTPALSDILHHLANHRLNSRHPITIDEYMQPLDAESQEVLSGDLGRWLGGMPTERAEDMGRWLYPRRQRIFRLEDVEDEESMEMVREIMGRSDGSLDGLSE
ncbi:MAG: hypothetical protein Q9213_001171 [Squamulea squamosa]